MNKLSVTLTRREAAFGWAYLFVYLFLLPGALGYMNMFLPRPLPEARLNLAQAAIYLARAPKSNASYVAIKEATADVHEHGQLRPPDAVRDASYYGARKLGRGQGYIYPHSDPAGFEVDHLPEDLRGRTYYRPSGSGEEEAPDGD
jgi:replication-associated recombination protein RarA